MMSGRLKVFLAFGILLVISTVSILIPFTAFAKKNVKFVVRFPWDSTKSSKIAIITPVPGITETIIVPTPSPTATPTPTLIPTPTITPTPTPAPIPEPQKMITTQDSEEVKPDSPSGNEFENVDTYLLRKMNEYRKQNGLSEIGSDAATCDFAMTRAREIQSNFSHEGFRSRIDSNTLPYPSYSYVNENIAQNSDFTRVIDSWINSPGHAENMRQNLSTACIRHSGEYYVFEGWRG